MKPAFVKNATHCFKKPENWNDANGACGDLYVRAETFGADNVIELFSAWKPSAEELAALNAGGVIEVGVCAAVQPVMRVGVAEEHVPDGGINDGSARA